jgi:hypothetical protein
MESPLPHALFASLLAIPMAAAAVPPETVHPGWTVVNLRPDASFKPMVTGMGFLSDGSLVLTHWGGLHSAVTQRQMTGAVYIVKNVLGDAPAPTVSTYAEKLEDVVGLLVKDDRIYISGGETVLELPDADRNGKADAPRTVARIPGTHARHEFLFGLLERDGKFLIAPSSATGIAGLSAWAQTNPNRGTVMAVDPATGAREVLAMGLREPNGMGVGPEGELFAVDVQGNWVPANKLVHIRKGRYYGFKHEPPETWDNMPVTPAAVELPQGEVSRSPGNPLLIEKGPFAGQLLLGDVAVGGIRRLFLEKVAGEWQGAAFFFGNGLEAGVNRLMWGPDGHLYAGLCGQGSGWSYRQDFGLQKLKPNGKPVFEMVSVKARQGGLEIEFTAPADADAADKAKYAVRSWHYTSTSAYNNPAQGTKTLAVASVELSPDKRKAFLAVPGLEARKVVHLALSQDIASAAGEALWTTEAWYTMNALGTSRPFDPGTAVAPGKAPTGSADFRAEASRGRLTVRMKDGGAAGIEVRGLDGKRVSTLSAGAEGVSTAGWRRGLYVVEARREGASRAARVLIP